MKIEKNTIHLLKKNTGLSDALRQLTVGEVIRLKTAREYTSIMGRLTPIGKQRGIFFGTRNQGDDVLVYIKGKRSAS